MAENDNRAELTKLLRLLREKAGLAFTRAVGEAGIAAGTFYRMERGDPRALSRRDHKGR